MTKLSDSNRAKVISRLEKVGYSKEEAIARVDKMSDGEIAYFAQHPESIRRSGFIILGSLIGSSIGSTIKSSNDKKAAELARKEEEIKRVEGRKRDEIKKVELEIERQQARQDLDVRMLELETDPGKKQLKTAQFERTGTAIKLLEIKLRALEEELKSLEQKNDALKNAAPKK